MRTAMQFDQGNECRNFIPFVKKTSVEDDDVIQRYTLTILEEARVEDDDNI
jgi:hypothetical protein